MTDVGGDVIVIGAGLIGLATAFELAERGAAVRVYDRAEPGRAASWAGAGMLAPYTEHLDVDDALLWLCETSLALYPAFVDRVARASGIDARLRLNGVVHAAFDDSELERLQQWATSLRARGVACESLDRDRTLAAEPWIGTHVSGALLIAREGHVDNRRLGRALAQACRARGVTIAQTAWLQVQCDERRALGIRSDLGFATASAIVNAAGAWAAHLEGVPAFCRPPVEPVKGEMLALAVPDGFVRHATCAPEVYFVPRDDGRVLVGATSVRVQFDARVTAGGVHDLLHAALSVAPSLSTFTVTETWAGLRPGSSDGRPFIGATPLAGLWLATGHYRNGILLAPATAKLLADAIGGEPAELTPFSLDRGERKTDARSESDACEVP